MIFETVRFLRRKNLGNYEHEEVELSGKLEDGDTVDGCLAKLKLTAETALGLVKKPVNTPDPKQEEVEEEKKVTKKVTKKVSKKTTTKKDSPEVEAEAVITLDEVRAKLHEVAKKCSLEVATKIVKDQGVAKSSELTEESYAEVMADCETALTEGK